MLEENDMDSESKAPDPVNQPTVDLSRSLNEVIASASAVLAALSNLSIEEALSDAVDQGRASASGVVSQAVEGPKAEAIASINAIAPTLQTNINDFLDALRNRAEEIGDAVAQIDLALEQELEETDADDDRPATS